jgi:hypothetical protein
MAYTDIDKPSDYFNTKLYTGNGSTQSITGVGFQPDWVWQKTRNYDYSHTLADVVRGASLNIFTNNTLGDQTVSNGLTSFDSDGFSVGADLGWNASASDRNSKVAWNWKAGGSASSNSNGSITSSVSASTDSGFSIVSFTGDGSTSATIGHGLGQTPELIIQTRRDSSTLGDWQVAVKDVGVAYINFANAFGTSYGSNGRLNYTGMTSTTYNFGTTSNVDAVNTSSATYITYCFASKKGFSKIGSYTGNGNADGTFVYTGFKPAFVMFKRTDSTSNWTMLDTKRSPHNLMKKELYANHPNVEAENGRDIDCLSNGIKIRSSSTEINASGGTYIYMAFAESSFVTSTGIPTTAR